jgi:hypothetical protein
MTDCGDNRQRHGDKRKVADFDACTEESQSEWDVPRWQSSSVEPAGKTETVEKSKGKGNEPGLALCEAVGMVAFAQDFVGDKEDAKCDHRFNRYWRNVNEAERGER